MYSTCTALPGTAASARTPVTGHTDCDTRHAVLPAAFPGSHWSWLLPGGRFPNLPEGGGKAKGVRSGFTTGHKGSTWSSSRAVTELNQMGVLNGVEGAKAASEQQAASTAAS
jgi:hypothetical protein